MGQNKVAYQKSASYLVWKCLKICSVGGVGGVGGVGCVVGVGGVGGPTDYFVTLNLSWGLVEAVTTWSQLQMVVVYI